MDFKQIQELIKLVNDSNIGEVTVEQKDLKITIRQKEEQITQVVATSMPMQQSYQQMQVPPQQAALPQASAAPAAPATPASEAPAASNLITIKSPMIGTFYRRPSPDKPNFIEVGDNVEPGKVVCIIEAMKLFNEIESEIKGKVVKILVEDSSPVEYDQPLFLVEPA
ncbi:MAG: acetyl-CoA carboxylase biotin carboxyl carrier protein [Chitinophagaceae bacterium]